MSAETLAAHVSRSPSAIRNQENGINGIRPEMAAEYAPLLGVTPQWILYGDGEPAAPAPPKAPVSLTQLANGKARLEMNMTVPFSVALQILALVEESK